MAINVADLIKEWWNKYQPDPRANYDLVVSTTREQLDTEGIIKYPGGVTQKVTNSNLQTGACQYWVKGLPAVCTNWNGQTLICTAEFTDIVDKPSGYGLGKCDMLGRRDWCSKYTAAAPENLEEFVCVAPCIEKSGLGRQEENEFGSLSYRPFLPSEIRGYNADEAGVGRCDGWGMGRSDQGPYLLVEDIYTDRPICRHYRPQQMGFGAIQPRPYPGSTTPGKPFDPAVNRLPTTLEELHDGSPSDPLVRATIRLPHAFQIYNSRAMYQKCAYWDADLPSFFEIDKYGGDPINDIINLDEDIFCICTEGELCDPYRNVAEVWPPGVPYVLSSVWAGYGGIICNGAKPECPCYTGKWIYCNDNNMRDGMRVTADQVYELRFWASNWSSQDEYDNYYLTKPGRTENSYADESTSDIYTFTEWEKFDGTNPNQSTMRGKKHHMCMPAPLNMRWFDPSIYITKELVTYPKIGTNTGTNVQNSGVSFPTLVRELEDPKDFVPDIFIVYPYMTTDPWDTVVCDDSDKPDYCFHDSNVMSDTYITFAGHTTSSKMVYVLNSELCQSLKGSKAKEYFDSYTRATQILGTVWADYNESVEKLLENCIEENVGIDKVVSNESGVFILDNVELKPNSENRFYVICRYFEDDFPYYTFRKIRVIDRYWGALITQTSAIHSRGDGVVWVDSFPSYFLPGVDIVGNVSSTLGIVSTVFSTYALYVYSLTAGNKAYYSYCINEYEEEDSDVVHWCQIGPTGYIWAELDNIQISYLWSLTIVDAYMELRSGDNTSVNLCGSTDNKVQLTLVFPESGVSAEEASMQRLSIPPDAIILKSENPMAFFNRDWKLVVSYKYKRLETFTNEFTIWPTNMTGDNPSNNFVESPYTIEHEEDSSTFSINNAGGIASKGTVKVMAYIVDEAGRVQTAAATKMLMQGCELLCRSVDIRYKYSADAIKYDLEPSRGFFTWRGPPTVNQSSGDGAIHTYKNKCGDHDCNDPYNCIGPVWFPFNDCTSYDWYNVVNAAAQCTMPISEGNEAVAQMGEGAWRYCLPEEYRATTSMGGSQWAAACATSFYFHYSKASRESVRFTGSGRKRAKIDENEYQFKKWTLPPFGNSGREMVERYLIRDYISFIDLSSPHPVTKKEYMPMVFDMEDLISDVNCFVNVDIFSPLNEPFMGFSMINNYLSETINESMSSERYRFDDIIDPVRHNSCMYPYPLEIFGGGFSTSRYSFKNENHIWAWQEYWKNIERNIDSTLEQFRFLDLLRPLYYFDAKKIEHRFITSEGEHTITFKPPEFEEDEDGNVNMSTYPCIQLDNGEPRFFELVYTSYSEENVTWMDESSGGFVGGSGGDGEGGEGSDQGGIYEEANNGPTENGFTGGNDPQWCHDFNTLFDSTAIYGVSEERSFYMGQGDFGGEIYVYYNRGLITNIPRNRLGYLPMDVTYNIEASIVTISEDNSTIIAYWNMEDVDTIPVTINVEGIWGISMGKVFSRPALLAKESNQPMNGDGTVWPVGGDLIGTLKYKSGQQMPVANYSIDFDLSRLPDRMLKDLNYFIVQISAAPGQEINVTSISADMAKYIEATETIKVWERKYFAGQTSSSLINADGPNSSLYRTHDWDRKNAGQYFPNENITLTEGNYISKLNMVSCGDLYQHDENIELTITNLKKQELEVQRELYEDAYNRDSYDTLNFVGVIPPLIRDWFVKTGAYLSRASRLTLTYGKINWDSNSVQASLHQEADFFMPGGHYFAWSEHGFRTRCYILGPVMTVYEVDWVHYKHGGKESTLDAGHAYAGWGRLEYYEGRLWQMGLSDTPWDTSGHDLLTQSQGTIYGGFGDQAGGQMDTALGDPLAYG